MEYHRKGIPLGRRGRQDRHDCEVHRIPEKWKGKTFGYWLIADR
jgi:hypothetical protein